MCQLGITKKNNNFHLKKNHRWIWQSRRGMFLLRVHSVEEEHPLDPRTIFQSQTNNPKFSQRRGALHLFRTSSHSSPSSLLFILAVPNYLSFHDFIPFCGPHLDRLHHLLFIRNDGTEDRYSVLIEFADHFAADAFYTNFNAKKFSPAEVLFLFSGPVWKEKKKTRDEHL